MSTSYGTLTVFGHKNPSFDCSVEFEYFCPLCPQKASNVDKICKKTGFDKSSAKFRRSLCVSAVTAWTSRKSAAVNDRFWLVSFDSLKFHPITLRAACRLSFPNIPKRWFRRLNGSGLFIIPQFAQLQSQARLSTFAVRVWLRPPGRTTQRSQLITLRL